ncbi:hypothetical protein DRJ54_07210 [Candidatus Acetothermia bacterium]|nr:MAG: hypothetical protein DRJ54_07210 [Candidatus Acetothermia bacterium]
MRILNLIPSLLGGGAERQLSYLAPEFGRLGNDIHIAYQYGGPNLARLEMSEVKLHLLRAKGNYDPSIFWQVIHLIRDIQPDIIQTWILQMDILGGLAARITKTPWVLRQPTSFNTTNANSFKNRIRTLLAAGMDAVVSNSVGGDLYWQKQCFSNARFIIPNALPLREIVAAPPSTLLDYGITPNQKVVLYAGRFAEYKNITNMVKAMLRMTEDTKIVAFLCGEGHLLAEVKQDLRQATTVNRIFLPGYVTDIWPMMKRADVFVSVSHFEGRPNAVIEAMACGTPLVVSDIPEHREFLDEQSAILVNRYDPVEIEKAIKDCLARPDAARRRAKTARNIVDAWSIESIAQQYVKMYKDVLTIRGC